MKSMNTSEVGGQWCFDYRWEHGDPILVTFAFTHDNMIGGEVNVFDAKPQPFS